MLKKDKILVKEGNLIEELFEAGAHYGYGKSRRHPSISPYIYGTKNNSDIIDLEKTLELLTAAQEFVKNLGKSGKRILLVGTKPEAKEVIKRVAESLGLNYVTARWIGGTLSNFSEIKRKISELETYHKDMEGGSLEKYTKKERVVMAKKMEKLATYYGGLLGMKKLPDALFVIDPKAEEIAATEARKSGVPVVALANSDSNIVKINYPIIANDSSIPSIKFFTESIAAAYKEGVASAPVAPQKETKKE